MLSEHDERQLKSMEERVQFFLAGQLTLQTLIADLDFLMSAFQTVDSDWLALLREEWAALEEAYAVKLDRGKSCLDADLASVVNTAISRLVQLLVIQKQKNDAS